MLHRTNYCVSIAALVCERQADLFRPEVFKKHLGIGVMALKLYSQEPISPKSGSSLVSHISQVKPSIPHPSLRSALELLHNASLQLFTLASSIRDVHMQIFKTNLKPWALPETVLPPTSRNWNLICKLCRRPATSSEFSRAYIVLHIGPLWATNLCKTRKDTSTGGGRRIDLYVSAHLRPSVSSETLSDSNGGLPNEAEPLQRFVNKINQETVHAIFRQDFEDANELLTAVKRPVLRYLARSPLAALVDFNFLEIVTVGARHERSVSNTLLNPNGTERTDAPTNESRPALPPPNESGKGPGEVLVITKPLYLNTQGIKL